MAVALSWLPVERRFDERLGALKGVDDTGQAWREVEVLARTQLDFIQTGQLDRLVERLAKHSVPGRMAPLRVALLAACNLQHLLPSLRVAGLRRGLRLEIYVSAFGQYFQELLDTGSGLHAFRPEVCCFVLDAHHLMDLS